MGIEVEGTFLFKDSTAVKVYESSISSPLIKIQLDGSGDFEIEISAKTNDECDYVVLSGINNFNYDIVPTITQAGIYTFDTLGYRRFKVDVKSVSNPITCNVLYCDEV